MPISDEKLKTNHCPRCQSWLSLDLYSVKDEIKGVSIELEDSPLLKCEKCSCHYLPELTGQALQQQLNAAVKSGRKTLRLRIDPLKKPPFPLCTDPEFIYDPLDYFYLPGLADKARSGQFQPVFFKPSMLDRYAGHPDYDLFFNSRGRGVITKEGHFSVSFGITASGMIFMWLGDLHHLPQAEQFHLRLENIPSDHQLDGPLYREVTGSAKEEITPEGALFTARNKADALCAKRRGRHLFYNINANPGELVYYLSRNPSWARHGGNRANTFDAAVNQSLNREFLESELAPYLNGDEKKIKNPILLLEKWLDLVLSEPNPADTAMPFYLLNDFRDIAMGLLPDDEIEEVWQKLNGFLALAGDNREFGAVFERLLFRVAQSLDEIADSLKIFTNEMNPR